MTRIDGKTTKSLRLPNNEELEKRVEKQAGGKAPADVYAAASPRLVSPANALVGAFPGYSWDPVVLDDVMKRYGIGDARALLRTTIAMDVGDRMLTKEELVAAAKKASTHGKHYGWSPSIVADVMQEKGIAEIGALLRTAQRVSGGDKHLSREVLERAADILLNVVRPHDVADIIERARETSERAGFALAHLGDAEGGLPIVSVHVPAKKQPPRLRVIITGGVHGDEPCGAAAAALLIEQLGNDPRLSEDVEWTIIPVVNPRSLAQGTRRTPDDEDLNRKFVTEKDAPKEVALLRDFFTGRECDLELDLHSGGSKRNGFWVLHKGSADIATPAMARFAERWPVLQGDTGKYDLSDPGVGESGSSETLKDLAYVEGAKWAMTVEAPGSVSYLDQVLGENEIVHEMVSDALARVDRPAGS